MVENGFLVGVPTLSQKQFTARVVGRVYYHNSPITRLFSNKMVPQHMIYLSHQPLCPPSQIWREAFDKAVTGSEWRTPRAREAAATSSKQLPRYSNIGVHNIIISNKHY